jgi:hypothetical protein
LNSHRWLPAGYDAKYLADSNANRENHMEQMIFMICMFFGIAAVALIAFTLLMIGLGRVDV